VVNPYCTNENLPAALKQSESEIPIARNANPAEVSTARPFTNVPMKPEQKDATQEKSGMPIARNSNPAGVSTARSQE
jgi:hypothetical protein